MTLRKTAQLPTKYISNVRYCAEFWQYLPKLVFRNGDTFTEGRQNIFLFLREFWRPKPATAYVRPLAAIFNFKEMRQILFGAILLLTFSCDKRSNDKYSLRYVDGRQLLTVNEIKSNGDRMAKLKIDLATPDSARVGEEFLAKIFLSETDFQIVDAFVDCENVDNASVDTVTYKVSGCKQGLMVKDDTILVAFKPTSPGLKSFSEITILTRDTDDVFRTIKYTFDYRVVEN